MGLDDDLDDNAPGDTLASVSPLRDDRYRVARGINWPEHADWIRELDRVPDLVDAFDSAMARTGASHADCRVAAVVCAAVLIPTPHGFALRPFAEWPPIVP